MASVTLLTPANHLRLRGKGFLAALFVEPEADMQVIQVLPSILLADTPRIAPPRSATAASSACRTRPTLNALEAGIGPSASLQRVPLSSVWSTLR